MAAVESGLPKVQQEPSEALRIGVENNGAENVPKDEQSLYSSECVVSIKEKLAQPRQDDVERPREKLSIYRIPQYLKDGEDKAYVPQTVSLGPYHHGKEHLRPMDQHKLRCLRHILKRSNHEIGLYLDSVKKLEEKARACYEGTISMSSDDFVQMMVLDGCFVIELFRGVAKGFEKLGYPCDDPVFSTEGSMLKIHIQRDMILLENQIPLFILDRLLGLQLSNPNEERTVAELVLMFFNPLTKIGMTWLSNQCGLHCLEVFWQSLLPSGLERVRTKGWLPNRKQLIGCVTELRENGIKFSTTIANSLGNIQFKLEDGILNIPQLVIHDGTRSLFLNLIAFEQSHFDCSNYITSYVIFMHNLINSPEEVRYLRDCRIIDHCLVSDAEVADLFNRLCQEVAFNIGAGYLYELSRDVKLYRLGRLMSSRGALWTKWNSWSAILKNKYFSDPWSIISLIAAFVLLALTFIQALFAVYDYYRPRS